MRGSEFPNDPSPFKQDVFMNTLSFPWLRTRSTRRILENSRSRRRLLLLEILENRALLTTFNDPDYATIQWGLNNNGQNGGKYDVDIDAPAAWAVTTGSMRTVLAEIDDGIDYTHPDVYLNIWLNPGEIPVATRASLADTDADAVISFRDLNNAANSGYVTDLNGTGYIDGGDLLHDPRWANGVDDEGNGKIDDLVGWDFLDNDNEPMPGAGGGHATGMAQWIGGIPNNAIGKVGVNWQISMMAIRIRPNTTTVDYAVMAAGVDYGVAKGAPIAAVYGGDYNFSQGMYDAVDRARIAGQLVVAPSANDSANNDVTPRYPASFNLDNIISVTSFNANDGMDTIWNWGPTSVDLGGPTATGGGTSGGAAHVAGVAALLKTIHTDWSYQQLKDRILSTVEPSAALAGKTVTGGRLNAARALSDTSISISDPSITEGNSGTIQLTFTVSRFGVTSGSVTLNWSTANGTALAGSDYVAASGQVSFSPGGANTQTIVVQISGDTLQESAETLYVNLSLASGNALLADDAGQGLIIDNDDTKFYVVDDGSTDKTFEYGATGIAYQNYAEASGNTAPRGAASTAAGDKVWVVDANKKVYVYDTSGGLLGSWSVLGLKQIEGITTNGTDIWMVDAKFDRLYRFDGEASRLSGSTYSDSAFDLNSGNAAPKDLVTDGTSIWVVNDAGTDKVFKYNLAGTLLGSWTISTAGVSAPTGITLDPASPNHLWIVDSGTDRVYQYDAAVGRISGSQAASTYFALSAGNTNPQGIADPPVGDVTIMTVATTAPRATLPAAIQEEFQATYEAGKIAAPSETRIEQRGLTMYLSDLRNTAKLLPADIAAPSGSHVAESSFSCIHDEALSDIAAELDRLAPMTGRRVRTLR